MRIILLIIAFFSLCVKQVDAQPSLTTLSPARHGRLAREGSVSATFSSPLQASSAAALRVFSTQRGGQKGGQTRVRDNQILFTPTEHFVAGEIISATLNRTAILGTDSLPMSARSHVWQMTVAATTGTGQFTPTERLNWPANPDVVIAADVDGDGDQDVLAVSTSDVSSRLSIRLNDGMGIFVPTADQTIPFVVRGMAPADMDNDGDIDLVLTGDQRYNGAGGGYYAVYANAGRGTFEMQTQTALSRTVSTRLQVGDVDADGDLDLLFTTPRSGGDILYICLNQRGQLTTARTLTLPPAYGHEMQLNDLDNDGDLDVLLTDYYDGHIAFYLNNGAGGLSQASIMSTAVRLLQVRLADLDGDGDLDLLTRHGQSSSSPIDFLVIHRNDGQGNFDAGSVLSIPTSPQTMTLADIDGDGDQDVLYSSDLQMHSHLNEGDGSFRPGTVLPLTAAPGSLITTDVDQDGAIDVLVAGAESWGDWNQLVLHNGPTVSAPYTVTSVSPPANQPAPRTTPIVATFSVPMGEAGHAVRVSRQLAAQPPTPTTATGNRLTLPSPTAFLPGELVEASVTRAARSATGQPLGRPYVWQFVAAATGGTGRFAQETEVRFQASHPSCLRLADIDGDGDLDIITAFNGFGFPAQSALLNVQRNQGGGRFSPPEPLLGANIGCSSFTLGDIDGDGDLDFVGYTFLLQADYTYGPAGDVWLNDGHGVFRVHQSSANSEQMTRNAYALGDLDGDGDLDLMHGGVRLNDGHGNFYGAGSITLARLDDINLSDIDGDGDLDAIVSTDYGYYSYMNKGEGKWGKGEYITGVRVGKFLVRDVDGDGQVDIVVSGHDQTFLYRNTGSGRFSLLSNKEAESSGFPLALGDINGDGTVDLLTTRGGRVTNGADVFSAAIPAAPGAGYGSLAAFGDLDGDGDLDVVIACTYLYSAGWVINFNQNKEAVLAVAPPTTAAVTVWPNPTPIGSLLHVHLPKPARVATIQLQTLTGQQVWQQRMSGQDSTIPAASLAAGVYLVTLQIDEQAPVVQRIVLE